MVCAIVVPSMILSESTTTITARAFPFTCSSRSNSGGISGVVSWQEDIWTHGDPSCTGTRQTLYSYDAYSDHTLADIQINLQRAWVCGSLSSVLLVPHDDYNASNYSDQTPWFAANSCGWQADFQVHWIDSGLGLDQWSYTFW